MTKALALGSPQPGLTVYRNLYRHATPHQGSWLPGRAWWRTLAGLLRREPDPTDRRGAFAVLTEEGYAALRQTWPAYARGIQEHFARYLNEVESEMVASVLERI